MIECDYRIANKKSGKEMKKAIRYFFYLIIANWVVTQTIDAYSHPDMTRTRCILRTPQTFFWNFKLK